MVAPGQVRNELVDMTDVLPTLAQVSNSSVPSSHTLDGRSFLPFLFGEVGNPRTWVMCQYERERFVMGDRYRLHSDRSLFDISNLPDVTILWPPSRRGQEDLSKDAAAARDRLYKVLKAHPTRRARHHRKAH
jgi:arylsulfatase A-like enzyme